LHLVAGSWYEGDAPWFTWPLVVASKVPLAVLALALCGSVLLLLGRRRGAAMTPAARWTLAAVGAAALLHYATLLGAQGTYGGVRHALPIALAVLLLAAAAVGLAVAMRRTLPLAAAGLLLALAAAESLPEPRAWEYHNLLAGGSEDAWRLFSNEGIDLGQRFPEVRAMYERHVAPSGLEMFSSY